MSIGSDKKRSKLFNFMSHPALHGVLGAVTIGAVSTKGKGTQETLKAITRDHGPKAARKLKWMLRGIGGTVGGLASAGAAYGIRKALRKRKDK